MKSFKEWQSENSSADPQEIAAHGWKSSKKDILKHWSSLPKELPLPELNIMPSNHKGPGYGYDGFSISGSPAFIDTVLSRLKDILYYENDQTRLQLIYKQQINARTKIPVPNSFSFYFEAKQRATKKRRV